MVSQVPRYPLVVTGEMVVPEVVAATEVMAEMGPSGTSAAMAAQRQAAGSTCEVGPSPLHPSRSTRMLLKRARRDRWPRRRGWDWESWWQRRNGCTRWCGWTWRGFGFSDFNGWLSPCCGISGAPGRSGSNGGNGGHGTDGVGAAARPGGNGGTDGGGGLYIAGEAVTFTNSTLSGGSSSGGAGGGGGPGGALAAASRRKAVAGFAGGADGGGLRRRR